MDAEDGRVPLVHVQVRAGGVGIGLLVVRHFLRVVRIGTDTFAPGSRTEIPVGEPHFFRLVVLLLRVEDAVVGDEAFETLVVVPGQVIDAVAAEAGPDAAEAVAVHIRFLAYVVDGTQVILHALPAVVAADFLQPLHAEARQAAAVGGDDDVAVGGHDLQVPAVAPELADGALRPAFAI